MGACIDVTDLKDWRKFLGETERDKVDTIDDRLVALDRERMILAAERKVLRSRAIKRLEAGKQPLTA